MEQQLQAVEGEASTTSTDRHLPMPRRARLGRRGAVLTGCGAAAVAALAGLVVAARSAQHRPIDSGAGWLAPPNSFQGLERAGNESDEGILREFSARELRGAAVPGSRLTQQIAVYGGHSGSRRLLFFGIAGRMRDPEDVEQRLLDEWASPREAPLKDFASFDPGPLGGALTCGTFYGEATTGVCVWRDARTVAVVINAPAAQDPGEAAAAARAYRLQAEAPAEAGS